MKVNIETNVAGKSPHTEEQRPVTILRLAIGQNNQTYFPGDDFQGELRAYFESSGFTPGSWNVPGYGLIQGNRTWLREFKAAVRALGLSIKAVQNIRYNDAELQGQDYVSLTIGEPFWVSWKRVQSAQARAEEMETFSENI